MGGVKADEPRSDTATAEAAEPESSRAGPPPRAPRAEPAAPARPHWVRSLVSLGVVLAVLAFALRVLHVGLPMLYPRVLQGPFSLDDVSEVEEYAGFSPLLPFFRPAELGPKPVYVTVFRRPAPRVVVLWQGEHFLYLEQTRGGAAPPVPADAEPLAVAGGARVWRHGRTLHVVARRQGTWVELRSDLDERTVRRVVETLRPLEELR